MTTSTNAVLADKDSRYETARAEIDAAIERLADPEGWKAFLDFTNRFHRYSLNNTLLIAIQRPDATQVMGAGSKWANNKPRSGWAALGRTIRKGEKAIWIYAPSTRKRTVTNPAGEEEERRFTTFRMVPVFDVSQTEGDELPENPVTYTLVNADVDATVTAELTAKITERGFRVRFQTLESPEHGGFTDFLNHQVVVNDENSAAEQARTLAHELAHIALDHGSRIDEYHTGHNGQRGDMEVEAESVAYVLAREYGIPTEDSSFAYIAGWAHGEVDKVKATATAVVKAVKAILDPAPAEAA